MKIIEKQNFPRERDLYAVRDVHLTDCTFDGEEDGESALKEAKNIKLTRCYMNLRYPLWHDVNAELSEVLMTENCRAALWYTKGVKADNCRFLGIKAVRECEDISIYGSEIRSPEFGWKSSGVRIENSSIESEYLFLLSNRIKLKAVDFKGKYSFQYTESVVIEDSVLDTKDAFWHAKNVTVKNSVVKGEYLGWFSENLTFENCTISGTQPLCYCKGLKLIGCRMENTDLSFEYSDVEADITGSILSVKNPRSGRITADGIDQLIITQDSVFENKCKIEIRQSKKIGD